MSATAYRPARWPLLLASGLALTVHAGVVLWPGGWDRIKVGPVQPIRLTLIAAPAPAVDAALPPAPAEPPAHPVAVPESPARAPVDPLPRPRAQAPPRPQPAPSSAKSPATAPPVSASAPHRETPALSAAAPAPQLVAPSLDGLPNLQPRYPQAARRRGQQGLVLLAVEVDAAGQVTAVELKRSSGHRSLDRAARRAVARWRFHPARLDDRPVAAAIEVPVRFRLTDG
jgi:protein TonB